jgi:hypothetical protein
MTQADTELEIATLLRKMLESQEHVITDAYLTAGTGAAAMQSLRCTIGMLRNDTDSSFTDSCFHESDFEQNRECLASTHVVGQTV